MSKIHLQLFYKTDAVLKVYLTDSDGDPVVAGTGTYELVDSVGSVLQSGSMLQEGGGWYFFQLPDDLSVSPGDILLAKVSMSAGGYQCYGEYEIYVETDRR